MTILSFNSVYHKYSAIPYNQFVYIFLFEKKWQSKLYWRF